MSDGGKRRTERRKRRSIVVLGLGLSLSLSESECESVELVWREYMCVYA